jgi:ABC-type lipoprotein export system ATPase subunit
MTCIMVTHNPDLECYADRVLYIEDGQVCDFRRSITVVFVASFR